MGSCHIEVTPEFLEQIRNMDNVTIVRATPDVTTVIAVIETSLLPDGYHGVQEVFTWPCSPKILRFRRETDT